MTTIEMPVKIAKVVRDLKKIMHRLDLEVDPVFTFFQDDEIQITGQFTIDGDDAKPIMFAGMAMLVQRMMLHEGSNAMVVTADTYYSAYSTPEELENAPRPSENPAAANALMSLIILKEDDEFEFAHFLDTYSVDDQGEITFGSGQLMEENDSNEVRSRLASLCRHAVSGRFDHQMDNLIFEANKKHVNTTEAIFDFLHQDLGFIIAPSQKFCDINLKVTA